MCSDRFSSPSTHQYARLLWLLTFLFLARVSGQAIQHWMSLPYLPDFDSFQGSRLPYWALLLSQLAILALMFAFSWRMQTGSLHPRPAIGCWLKWLGGFYMIISLGRIMIGLIFSAAPAWFSTWLPAFFHIVLAGYILTFTSFHLQLFCAGRKN